MKITKRGSNSGACLVAVRICCCLFLSTRFSGSHKIADAATTSANQQPHKRLELTAAAATAVSSDAISGQTAAGSNSRQSYFGTLVGKLSSASGQVSGEVYAVDEQTLFIRGFDYDGQAPDAYFWSSTSSQPRPSQDDGFIVPDEKGSTKPLERYANKDIVLRLPEGKTLREIPWLSIWSRQLRQSVGEILIPRRELVIPRPLEVAPLSQLAHGLKSGPITIVDAQTLLVADFHYDGLGPDAYFWLTRGQSGLSGQNSVKLKDENGLSGPLRKYQGETIVISLPDEFTIYDFDFFGVWCKKFSANFGQTRLPGQLALEQQSGARVPPSPKMLGIKPENKLNCEILYDDLGFEIRWVLDGDDIVMQLVGKIEPGEYMAFGLGKDDSKSEMNNADAVVAWVERATGQVHATDYFLGSSKQQCVNDPKRGSCPDVKLTNGSDSLTLLHGAIVNGYSMVTFKRPQLGVDELYDQHVYSDGQQSVIWAIGTLNARQEIGYHRLRTRTSMFIDFARNPQWNCPIPDLNASMHNNAAGVGTGTPISSSSPIASASQVDQTTLQLAASGSSGDNRAGSDAPIESSGSPTGSEPASDLRTQDQASGKEVDLPQEQRTPLSINNQLGWFIPQVVCPNERTFYASIGPTAGKRAYASQTGRTSWVPPVSWYINGLLVPELVVERGQSYRFIVEGGNDKTGASRRHPLYLTDSPDGGFNFKTDAERVRERIFGGVAMRATDGQFVPTAEGRLCEWKQTNATLSNPDLYPNFSSYQRSLKLDCLPGQGAVLKFSPDANTPDLIYYQCYTNRFMGWRIRVVDSCGAYIRTQLNQLKRQQQMASASALALSAATSSGGNRSTGSSDTWRDRARSAFNTRAGDKLTRRESNQPTLFDLIDLKPQASESRMLAFEAPPPSVGMNLVSDNQQQRLGQQSQQKQRHLLSETEEFALLQAAAANGELGADFGDEFAASDELLQHSKDGANSGGGGEGMMLLNNSFLLPPTRPRFNLSNIEQILKLSPSDLEFLDDSQLDLVSAVALASASSPNQFLLSLQQPLGQPFAAPKNQNITQQQQPTQSKQNSTKPTLGTRMVPKSLHNYMRRLASIYQPVQQQLASLLSLQSLAPQQQQAQANQQQLLASLHQQILAASASVPSATSFVEGNKQQNNAASQSSSLPSSEPSTSASSTASFSLASLVPKSKIDLSKSNLGKRFNKLRIKTGRKYEPTQQPATSGSSNSAKQSSRPPTPDNEFNYDIFNNQLAQLEERQKQLQNYENFAAALAAANSNLNWQMAPQTSLSLPNQMQQTHYQTYGASNLETNVDNFLLAPNFEQLPRHQQHFVEPLQQQQSTLNILENFERPLTQHQQAAVFIKRLPPSSADLLQQQQRQTQFVAPQQNLNNKWQLQDQAGSGAYPRQEAGMQQKQANRPVPSYLDSTDYNSIRQSSPQTGGQRAPPVEKPSESGAELLSGSDGTNHYSIGRQPELAPSGEQRASSNGGETSSSGSSESDHMLAIERYSKQSSERRPPSIVHPITGEQVAFEPRGSGQFLVTGSRYSNHTEQEPHHQAVRFSSKLIDKHIMEPTTNGELYRATQTPAAQHNQAVETLDTEQSAESADLRRLNGNEPNQRRQQQNGPQTLPSPELDDETKFKQPQATSTTELPQVLLRPASALDFFSSDPPATTMAYATPTSTLPPASSADPLIPSMGLPSHLQQPQTSSASAASETELVLRTNLIEPIKSTLVPTSSSQPFKAYSQQQPSFSMDSGPFTPIEFANSPSNQQHRFQQQQVASAASNLLAFRLRPPALVESMLNQYRSPSRPEPPVRVASYLARQLTNSNQRTSQSAATSNGLGSDSGLAAADVKSSQQNRDGSNGAQSSSNQTSGSGSDSLKPQAGLIILKPALLNANQVAQSPTYALRPEYLTTSDKADGRHESHLFKAQFDGLSKHLDDLQQSAIAAGNQLYGLDQDLSSSTAASRRLAVHQFDRLSSLSSPPTTSMVLDPLQVSNSMQTYNFHATDHRNENDQANNSTDSSSSHHNTNSSSSRRPQATAVDAPTTNQTYLTSLSSGRPPHQMEFNILQRDNNTDNAILSHVMSLISSNAIPTPPLVPLASAYTSADYFLPAGDVSAHQHHQHSHWRRTPRASGSAASER